MARRGFFAELQHQSCLAARERERAERETVRRHVAAVRQAEQAKKISERAKNQLAKSADSERKRLEKEAREAHLAAMEAEVLERNGKLEQIYAEIDSLLASTLGEDDYVDLNLLRIEVTQPPFDRTDLEVPIPQPSHISDPREPVLVLPTSPSGLASFFGKKKHAEAVANAQRVHEQALIEWREACRDVVARRQNAEDVRARDEARRLSLLKAERERYPEEMRSPSGHLREEKKYEGTAHVYEKRWEQISSSFKELEEYHLQAQVEWGPEFQNRIEKLRRCRVELMSAIQDLLEGYKNPGVRAATTPQENREARSVLYWGGGSEFDKFTPQIDDAIDEFETWLRPKVSK